MMTEEDKKADEARWAARAEELAAASDAYLVALGRDRDCELSLISAELARRVRRVYQKVIAVPCQVRELETALTTYMNSHGLADGTVNLFPDENGGLAVFIRPPKEDK